MTSARPAVLLHAALAAAVILGLPLGSLWWGSGTLAFTMFARSSSYRLRLETIDQAGAAGSVAPTAVAAAFRGTLGDMLAGTERLRHGPHGPLLRARLAEIATLTCRFRPRTRHVRAELVEKPSLDEPTVRSFAEVACPQQ